MPEIASSWVSILPSAKGFGSSLNKQVGSDVKSSGKTLGSSFGKVFGAVAAIGIGAMAFGFLKGSLEEAREAAVVGARTDNVIKKMGASSWTSSKQVGALAGALSAKSGVDDEAIQSGQNLLLTFGKVQNAAGKGNDIFNQTSGLMLDMSRAMGTDAKAAALRLGKALNDPTKGVTALTRSGVSFTQGQRDQIKAMQASGNMLGAQKVILGEVQKQFGGAAAAMATPADKARVAWGNFQESMGTLLLPMVDRVLSAVAPLLVQMGDRLPGAMKQAKAAVAPVVSILQRALGPVVERVTKLLRENPAVVKAFAIGLGVVAAAIAAVTLATTLFSIALNSTGIPLIIIGLAALVAGLILAYKRSSTFRDIVQKLGAAMREFGGWLRSDVLPVLQVLAARVEKSLRPVFAALNDFFVRSVLPTVQRLVVKFREWQPAIQKVIGVVVKLIAHWVAFYATMMGKVLPPLIRFAGFLVRNVIPAIAACVAVVKRIISALVSFGAGVGRASAKVVAFASTVGRKIGDVSTWFKGLPGKILTAVSGFGSLLYESGKELIGGLIAGIEKKAKEIAKPIANIAGAIKDRFPGSPVKKGPLTAWNRGKAGERLMEMLGDGITSGAPGVVGRIDTISAGLSASLGTASRSHLGNLRGIVAQGPSGTSAEQMLAALSAINLAVTVGADRRTKAQWYIEGQQAAFDRR